MCVADLLISNRRKMAAKRSSIEESGGRDTKVSDSGYSNSCSNSQSQRSSGSSESRHSSSSGGSGYCGHQSALGSINESAQQPPCKRKDKDHKKKKCKGVCGGGGVGGGTGLACQESPITCQTIIEVKPPTPSEQQASQSTQSQIIKEDALVGNCGSQTPSNENESLQIAALTHTLSCIKKLKSKDEVEPPKHEGIRLKPESQEKLIKSLKAESGEDEELSIIVSLKDGVVVCTSTNLTEFLGFPKDMWVGRSIIDFIHPKHRAAFATHITTIITGPTPDITMENLYRPVNGRRSQFFCCLRQYKGLRSCGFSMAEKPVPYLPCQLTMAFREVPESPDPNNSLYLVISATAVRSAYKYGEELKLGQCWTKFTTRHLASTCLSYVDPEVTSYFGYLPQDIIGKSVFEFYHHEDMPLLKEIYELVMKDQSRPVRSKPYRFRCQNGCYALIETEWSTFINPWMHKMEFIIGQHSILRGPSNPDVITPVDLEPAQIPENLLKENKALQDQIKCLLKETVVQASDHIKQEVSKRCKDLATFMETLVEAKPPDLKVEVQTEDQSFSERDSVMLGEISPHHDYYNSNSSSGTPPSYNQLNYNENLQRFFESKPKTNLSDESRDSKNEMVIPCTSSGEDDKTQPPNNSSDTSIQRSSCLNSGTSSGQSTGSNNCQGNQERQEAVVQLPREEYKPPTLTEQILTKHNEDMEKQMMKKHREARSKCDGKSKERHKSGVIGGGGCHDKTNDKMDDGGGGGGNTGGGVGISHGVKRSGSHSWEGEPLKSLKTRGERNGERMMIGGGTQDGGGNQNGAPQGTPGGGSQTFINQNERNAQVGGVITPFHQPPLAKPLNLWPPFSVGVMPFQTTPPTFTTPAVASPILPMYYISEPRQHQSLQHSAYITPQVSFVPDMVYHPLAMFGASPVVYSPLTVLPSPVYPPGPSHHLKPSGLLDPKKKEVDSGSNEVGVGGSSGRSGGGVGGVEKGGTDSGRPQSTATSIKAEPGSALCSIASASLQQPPSEKGREERLSPTSLSPQGGDLKKSELDLDSSGTSNVCDDSSLYSSFDSFLKMDKSDESMKSSSNEGKTEEMIWERSERQGSRPIKKVAPWLEDINMTSDLVLKYQIQERELCDILKQDSKILERFTQPSLVNDQLTQMYLDLELEGLSKHLTLDEGITSSSDSSGEENSPAKTKKKRYMEYDKMVIVFEENAPLPPPAVVSS